MYVIKIKFKNPPPHIKNEGQYLCKTLREQKGKYFSSDRRDAVVLDEDEMTEQLERIRSAFGSAVIAASVKV